MSVVPPSPPWAMTRTSLAGWPAFSAFTFSAAAMPVVTYDHIPFFSAAESINGYMAGPPAPSTITVNGVTTFRHTVGNAKEVLARFRNRHLVLALGGHVHIRERLLYEMDGLPTRFEQSAAIVGT